MKRLLKSERFSEVILTYYNTLLYHWKCFELAYFNGYMFPDIDPLATTKDHSNCILIENIFAQYIYTIQVNDNY